MRLVVGDLQRQQGDGDKFMMTLTGDKTRSRGDFWDSMAARSASCIQI